MRKIVLFAPLLFMACAHQSPRHVKDSVITKAQIKKSAIAKSGGSSREKNDAARERAMILAKKRSIAEANFSVNPQRKQLQMTKSDLIFAAPTKDEMNLLKDLRDRYETNDELRFQSRYQAMKGSFPNSASLPEVHYMAGMMALSNKNYGQALRAFDLAMQNPRSPQAPKAMFAKAITFQRMSLREPSIETLHALRARYPKTLESQRAALELKVQEQKIR